MNEEYDVSRIKTYTCGDYRSTSAIGEAGQLGVRKPMVITIDWNSRDPEHWNPFDLMKTVQIPSKWPKGQSVWDRVYWLDLAVGQSIDSRGYDWKLSGLLDSALGLLWGGK